MARLVETAALSESSCSFTTSNDDDSSSTTTEPTSNISPNVRFKRSITYWEKGELLGRGSFGSVYEGISDLDYLIVTRLDITHVVHLVSQFLAALHSTHYVGILLTAALLLVFVSFWETILFPGVLLEDVGLTHSSPTVIHCDNRSVIQIAHNDVFLERTKHIEIDCHLVRHHLCAGILRLLPVSSSDQIANIFMKTFLPGRFRDFVSKLKMASVLSLMGDVNIFSKANRVHEDFIYNLQNLMAAAMGPRTLHLRMQHEKILAHLKIDGAAVKSKEFVSVTENNKTNLNAEKMSDE
uniref:Uncharacterized protein n=1 Tax=Fagus sylvatica TaxID=28930 RepID=A0A2N9HV22_FAGSY